MMRVGDEYIIRTLICEELVLSGVKKKEPIQKLGLVFNEKIFFIKLFRRSIHVS
jgi:hypothetical protein